MLLSRAQLELVFWKWCNLQAHFTNHKESTSSLPSASPPPALESSSSCPIHCGHNFRVSTSLPTT